MAYMGNNPSSPDKGLFPSKVITGPAYNILPSDKDYLLLVDSTTENVTLNLPETSLVPLGFTVHIKKTASENSVIIDGHESEAINGSLTRTITSQWDGIGITRGNDEWFSVSSSGAGAGASTNSSDATLLNRTNHTGTQAIATVSGLQTALDGKQATLVSGTNLKTINGTSLLGSGNLEVIGGSSGGGEAAYLETSFTAQTSVTVTHNFGAYPIVFVMNDSNAQIIPVSIVQNSLNDFTVTFSSATTGKIISMASGSEGGTGGYLETTFTSRTSVTVTHNFGVYPVVFVMNSSNAQMIPLSVVQNNLNSFTVTFSSATTGKIISMAGTPGSGLVGPTSTGWEVTNVTEKKKLTASNTTLTDLANVVGTLINSLTAYGVLAAGAAPEPSPSLKPVIILIGQSNAVGVGTIASAPSEYQGTIAGAKIWNGTSFVNLTAGTTNQAADSNTFGPELSLCKQYLTRSGNTEVYLIKHAVSNTSLNVNWLPTSGAQYTAMIAKINAALSDLGTDNYSIKGFVWVQGENDALSASPTPSNNYQTNLTNLISNLRSTYGSSIPFVAAQLGYLNRNLYYYQDNVRNAQNLVQRNGVSVYVARTDDLGYNNDLIHYNAAAQVSIGTRAANHIVGDAGYIENLPPSYSDIKFWFDPSTYNTCLDSSSLPVSPGGNIQAVLGRQVSPLINVAQLTVNAQPTVQATAINGRQAARFDGSNDQLFVAGANPSQILGATSGTIFLIQRYAVEKAATSMFINAGTNSIINIANKWTSTPFDDIFWDFASQSTGRIYGPAPSGITGNWKVTEFVKRSAGTSEVFVGGSSALSGSTSATMASATGTLRIATDGSSFFNGDIAEIICYNKELNSTERTAVYSYINNKYGL